MYYHVQGGGGRAEQAFTMAEILLSLTIIGVVAAITLPSLTGNINERTWNTQRKALYARFSQAISLMPALNGYGVENPDTAAETFVTAGLSKVLKINNICDNDHLADCGLASKITTQSASTMAFPTKWSELNPQMVSAQYMEQSFEQPDSAAAAFETQNGESIAVFYNPNCSVYMDEGSFYLINSKVCANLIFDLNGNKGPNTVGKDIGFMTITYPTDSVVVAPQPAPSLQSGSSSVDWLTATRLCREYDTGYRLPNKEEAGSMFVNKLLLGVVESANTNIWTSSLKGNDRAFHMYLNQGVLGSLPKANNDYAGADIDSNRAWCIER